MATYRAPFNRIPVLDWLTGNVSYNATYRWDRGAEVDGVSMGNSIANQAAWNMDGRLNFESLYKKFEYLKKVDTRFAAKKTPQRAKKPKKVERIMTLLPDTSLVIKHNLRAPKVKVVATTVDGKPFKVTYKPVDNNSVAITTRGDQSIKFVIEEVLKEEKKLLARGGRVCHASRHVGPQRLSEVPLHPLPFAPAVPPLHRQRVRSDHVAGSHVPRP